MALSNKNIVISPNIGAAADPKIVFSGADASTAAQNITLTAYPTNGGTLSFDGSVGQLFSVTNSMTGTIFSVNDVSGMPSIEVLDNGLVKIGQYSGNVLLGSGTDTGLAKLQVTGAVNVTGTYTSASGGIWVGGNIFTVGVIQGPNQMMNGSDIQIINKAGTGWVNFATRNTGGSEAVYNLGSIGTLSATGDATISDITVGRGGGWFAHNTAVGRGTLYVNSSGDYNTAVGFQALNNNTSATDNVAIGNKAMFTNTTGYSCVAIGSESLLLHTTGDNNVAIGLQALRTATSAYYNTAIGSGALYNTTTGSSNTVVGYQAGYQNGIGANNTAIGRQALYSNSSGNYNTTLGRMAGYYISTGGGNTSIAAYNAAGSYLPVFDPTTHDNRFCMGSTGVTNAYIQVAWTVVSDARDKTNFAPIPHGLDFINKLKPTAFQFAVSRTNDTPAGPLRYGFKAQDILALEGDNPVVIDAEDLEKLRFNESSLIPILVKAIQELTARIAVLETK